MRNNLVTRVLYWLDNHINHARIFRGCLSWDFCQWVNRYANPDLDEPELSDFEY
jgi:hypothetical protein